MLVSALSCENRQSEKSSQNEFFGSWLWVSTTYHTRSQSNPTIKDPSGDQYILELKAANKAILKKNGKDVLSMIYELEERPQGETMFITFQIDPPGQSKGGYADIIQNGPIRIEGETMTISGGYNDLGGTVKFIKY